MADDISSREELAALINGKSDDEVNAEMAQRGTESVLGAIFEFMATRFQAERASGQSAVIGWDISTPDGTHQYQLKVEDGACVALTGAPEPARVTLGMALPDFLRFSAGQLDGMQAFMSGKLKLTGDMMFAQAVGQWFG